MASRVTLVLGGARSGKSRHAEQLVMVMPPPWIYVATAEALDDEMRARIAVHRARRVAEWQIVEAPLSLTETLAGAPKDAAVLVDCLTLWLTNLMLADIPIGPEAERLERALAARDGPTVLVANEVGLGIVPKSALARRFRDEAGWLNQRLAALADRVEFLVAGIAMRVK